LNFAATNSSICDGAFSSLMPGAEHYLAYITSMWPDVANVRPLRYYFGVSFLKIMSAAM
jgi:hypothetical protein